MTEDEIKAELERIDSLDHVTMATLWRFAPAGHPYFNGNSVLWERFSKRFMEFGGMTPEVSKLIGHVDPG